MITQITQDSRPTYEAFLRAHHADLYQSWAWGQFQKNLPGRGKFWTFLSMQNQKERRVLLQSFEGTVLVVQHHLPFGLCWLSIVRGPVFNDASASEAIWAALWASIEHLARMEKAVFVRVELPKNSPLAMSKALHQKGWRTAHAHHHPEWTLVLDLSLSKEQLLAQMKPKGRYNIRIAEKHGVSVRATTQSSDLDAFYHILEQTGERDGFSIHPKSYYQTFLQEASSGNWGKLFVAEYKDAIIAGILATFYDDTATYYYGASDYEHRALMAPYLLQWIAIQDAKTQGFVRYDFLGISPPNTSAHAWGGVTDFKMKFGGTVVSYPPAREFVFKPFWYTLMRIRKWFGQWVLSAVRLFAADPRPASHGCGPGQKGWRSGHPPLPGSP